MTLAHYLAVGSVLFCIGLYGALVRKNFIVILMSIELMLNAVNINLVAFSRFLDHASYDGQIFALFIMIIAASEAAVGLAILLAIFRNTGVIETDSARSMKG
ncbi:MAG: NADH-quinone oxidoreductase subunit NuoK, partial [Nitrospirae bacterium]|nr:NADH-quinone oxidoreductase subunit NuoK [Nitrospirota bacterium]